MLFLMPSTMLLLSNIQKSHQMVKVQIIVTDDQSIFFEDVNEV